MKIIKAVTSTFLIVYLAGAFITWQPNPRLWTDDGRFIYVFMSFIFGAYVAYVRSRD